MYIETSTIVSAIAMLIVIRMSSSTGGSGSTIITTTSTTPMRDAEVGVLQDRSSIPARPAGCVDGDRPSQITPSDSLRREVR